MQIRGMNRGLQQHDVKREALNITRQKNEILLMKL